MLPLRDGLHAEWLSHCSCFVGDPSFSGLGVDAVFHRGGGGSRRISVSPFQLWSTWAGVPVSFGHSGGEAGCFSQIRVSQASATICWVTGSPADDDEATARSRIGRMASATLCRPISCSSVSAAICPSRDLGDSSESHGRCISCPGVRGNDVTGDETSSSNTILSKGPDRPGSCCSCDASASCSPQAGLGPIGSPPRIRVGSRSSARSWR